MKKIYLVELNIFKENAFHSLQKIPLDNFPRNFYIWSAIVSDACMQKIKIGHRANFRAKNKCFRQILFPVRAILRSINFRYVDFNTRELKHAHFWGADGNRTRAVFTFNLPSHDHIHIAKYLFSIKDEEYKNLRDNTFLARKMFSSGCRPRLKNARA